MYHLNFNMVTMKSTLNLTLIFTIAAIITACGKTGDLQRKQDVKTINTSTNKEQAYKSDSFNKTNTTKTATISKTKPIVKTVYTPEADIQSQKNK